MSTNVQLQTGSIVQRLIEPLCDETKQLLSPVPLRASDRLHVAMDEECKRFIVTPMTAAVVKLKAGWSSADSIKAYAHGFPEHRAPDLRWEADVAGGGKLVHLVPGGSIAATRTWVERVPERKELATRAWMIAATDFNAIIINALWSADKLYFEDDAKTVYEFLLARFMQQTLASAKRAHFKTSSTVASAPTFEQPPNDPLAPYQNVAVAGSIGQEGTAYFMEQGTGKTPCAIVRWCAEAKIKNGSSPYRVLVVCPKNVRANWVNECERFKTSPGRAVALRGGKFDRIKTVLEAVFESTQRQDSWMAVVSSYESVQNTWDAISRIEWDLVVLDESHYIKWWRARRTVRVMKLREISTSRMCLTGTPITNHIFDLWTQLEFLGEGLSGFLSFENFRSYYGKFMRRDDGMNMLIDYQNLPILRERLARMAFMIRKEEALPELPPKLYSVREVTMTEKQTQAYRELATRLIAEIQRELDSENARTVTVTNVLVKLLRLAQITSGFISFDAVYDEIGNVVEAKVIDRFDPNPKLEELVQILKERQPNEKSIVWACFVQDIKSIRARLEQENIDCVTFYGGTSDDDREIAERRFNKDPKCTVLIGNPGAGGTGLNLRGYDPDDPNCNTNCTQVIYFSQDWSMTKRSQSEDRAHRRGTRQNVEIIDLCVPRTIDEEIRTRVTQKRITAYAIQDVKSILERIAGLIPAEVEE